MDSLPTPPSLLTRKSLCLSQPEPNVVIHDGDQTFTKEVGRIYSARESNLLEELVQLKATLRRTKTDDFWSLLTERMAGLLDAQMSFISKRILVDEQDTAVEMPPIGEPGACLMASAFHYNTGKGGESNTVKAFKYNAWGCPCGYMRHDKVFIIPERLNDFVTSNPNKLPFLCEAYIGIPLFADGKCFAHFGVMWSVDGAKRRRLPWAHIELFMHSLEDIILQRLLEGSSFVERDPVIQEHRDRNRIIPHEAVTAAQSLKPYAKSLSHELRTPMQGVVGMLDVMYATVQEAAEGVTDSEVRKVFATLKENIETVQDSSRRAVEAADNVVHAYDMDMHVPDGPSQVSKEDFGDSSLQDRPAILVEGSNLPMTRPNKRRREDASVTDASPSKIRATAASWAAKGEPSDELRQGVHEAEELPQHMPSAAAIVRNEFSSPKLTDRAVAPGMRHTQIRSVLQYVVNEGLKVGGRPESAIARETDLGETIEVQTRIPNGEPRSKLIEWSVDGSVPETMFIDEKDLGKLVSCVFLNAVKFTEQGRITVTARMSSTSRYVVIRVTDTGPGIPAAFLPKLFKPFSQEDPSLTRQSEGLGLGLLVAKGIARKLGGDLLCIRADTSPATHGSEFEMRVPVTPGETKTRHSSPVGSPAPSRKRNTASLSRDYDVSPRHSPPPTTPRQSSPGAPNSTMGPPPIHGHSPIAVQSQFQLPVPPIPGAIDRTHNRPHNLPARPMRKSSATILDIDRNLALKHPLTFLVAEDNKINRKLLVNMLNKFGYKNIHEAYDGAEAVRQMQLHPWIDVVMMDIWMPFMDGYEATEKILNMANERRSQNGGGRVGGGGGDGGGGRGGPTVLAVTADVTDGALERAAKVGMKGFMTKPFKLLDLQRLILEYCSRTAEEKQLEDGRSE